MLKKTGIAIVVLVLVGGIAYFIYSSASTSAVEIDITLGEGSNWFTPTNATARLGERLTIVVFNDDDQPHSFGIQAFNASTGVIRPGYSGRTTFLVDQAGSFPFYSPLNSTDAQGESDLNGTLTVRG